MAKITPGKGGSRKDAITLTASGLFGEKVFPATSVRDIAEATGVEAPSLYDHTGSKSEILNDNCFRTAHLLNSNLREVGSGNESNLLKMERIVRFHILMMVGEYESLYISEHGWMHLPEPFPGDFKTRRRAYRNRLVATIEKGI